MKCHRHHEVEAVAICVHCGKAVCPECENEGETLRITCSEACGEAAARQDVLITAVRESFAATARSYRGLTIVAGTAGLITVLTAVGGLILTVCRVGTTGPLLLEFPVALVALGSVLLLASAFLHRIARKYEAITRQMK